MYDQHQMREKHYRKRRNRRKKFKRNYNSITFNKCKKTLNLKEINLKTIIPETIKIIPFKKIGVSMDKFRFPSGMIVDLNLNECSILKKIISMGIFPGQRIQILNKSNTNYLIEVKNTRIAINRELAQRIFLIP
ncbi:MAG: FeoA family protein [Promethearchaeota archaeon]